MEDEDADYNSAKNLADRAAKEIAAGFSQMTEKQVRSAINIFEIKSISAEKMRDFYCRELNKLYAERHGLQQQLLDEKKRTFRAEEKYALALAMATGILPV